MTIHHSAVVSLKHLLKKVTSNHCSAVKRRRLIGGNNQQTNKQKKQTNKERQKETNKQTKETQNFRNKQRNKKQTTATTAARKEEAQQHTYIQPCREKSLPIAKKLLKFSPVLLALEHLFKPNLPMTWWHYEIHTTDLYHLEGSPNMS